MSVEEQEIHGGFQVGRGGLLCCVVLDASGMVFCTQFDGRLLILPSWFVESDCFSLGCFPVFLRQGRHMSVIGGTDADRRLNP